MIGKGEKTLQSILESAVVPKVFFDVRNDFEPLYAHFGIALQCVQDVQLMEVASRLGPKKFVSGLPKCIERDAPITLQEKQTWKAVKDTGAIVADS